MERRYWYCKFSCSAIAHIAGWPMISRVAEIGLTHIQYDSSCHKPSVSIIN